MAAYRLQGADCKLRRTFGETPLDFAISSCNVEVLDALKKAGVKVDDWVTEDEKKVWEEEDEEEKEGKEEEEEEEEEPFYLYENVTYNKTAESNTSSGADNEEADNSCEQESTEEHVVRKKTESLRRKSLL